MKSLQLNNAWKLKGYNTIIVPLPISFHKMQTFFPFHAITTSTPSHDTITSFSCIEKTTSTGRSHLLRPLHFRQIISWMENSFFSCLSRRCGDWVKIPSKSCTGGKGNEMKTVATYNQGSYMSYIPQQSTTLLRRCSLRFHVLSIQF